MVMGVPYNAVDRKLRELFTIGSFVDGVPRRHAGGWFGFRPLHGFAVLFREG